MRIALIGPTFPYKGGGAHHTTELAHRLAAAGHDVTLESWRDQYPSFLYPGQQTIDEPEGERFPNTRYELSWRRPDGWLRTGRRLGGSYDLAVFAVLSPVQVPSYLGILAGIRRPKRPKRLLGAPPGRQRTPERAVVRTPRVVALCHNVLPHERKPYDRPLVRRLLRRVDDVLVHSAQQAELAGALTSRPVRVAELPPHLPTPERAPRILQFHPSRRLLFFGIVRPYKGLDVLLRALAAGPDDVSLVVAGEFWGGLDGTEQLIEELGLAGRVELRPGYVPAAELPRLFAKVDALVLPYRTATASQNVFLAYEHDVPVITTRAGTLADHVRDGVDGLVCEPDDVDDLAKVLKRFYEPGEPARLRAGVAAVDPEPYWTAYLGQLLA